MEPDRTESLLADLRWLRALARELVRDPELADDAVQDACVAALRHDGAIAHRRAWLATVLRNCLALRRRASARAERREAAAALGPEARIEPAATLVERAELQQRLVAAVLALPAPQRDAVLMRFFDSMPPRAIARRLDVPVATVHSRLQRGLQQLRRALDAGGDGRAALALAALALPTGSPWPLVVGVLMQTKWKVAVAALVAVGSMTWWWAGGGGDPGAAALAADAGPSMAARSGAGGGDDGGRGTPAGGRRTVLEPKAPGASPAAPERFEVRGRVLDCDGRALAGVPIAVRGEASAASSSDAAGAFVLSLPRRTASLTAAGERFVTVLGAEWSPDTTVEPVLVVAPALRVAGTVVDARALPVPRAQVLYELPEDFDTRFARPLDRGERGRWSARAGADGTFDLGRVPAIGGAQLLAVADALAPASVPLPTVDDTAVQIVLTPFAWEEGQLDGIVVDAGGVPVPGARVAMGVTSVVSDGDGRFALLLRRAGWPTAIVAAKQGYLPGRFELPRGGGADRADWPDEIVLRLGGPPLSIHGVVLDQDEQPVEGAAVWVDDPTLLGIAGMLPVRVEYLLGGGELPRQAATMPVPLADDPGREDLFMDQTTGRMVPTACWYFVRTAKDGRFELTGLLPRDYRLRAFDAATGTTAVTGPVPAGGRADVRLARDGLLPRLSGRVVSLRGAPLAGVEVACRLAIYEGRDRVPGGWFAGRMIPAVGSVRTDEDGRFEFEQLHRERAELHFASDAILPRMLAVADVVDPLSVTVEVEARCHVEVALADPTEADEVLALDGDGEQIDIAVLRSGSHQALTDLPLHDGRSGVFVLGERAARLVLRKLGQPVREVPLQLRPGETFRVR
ncbi:MAG: sigma-70 family RNA polymerase sigma factor [Planctomycetota bacterium]